MPATGRPVGMARPAGSVFNAGNAVLFDLDDTLADRDRARDRFFSFLLDTYFPDLKPEGTRWSERMDMLRGLDRGGRGSKAAIHDYLFGERPVMPATSFVELMRSRLATYTSWADGAESLLRCLQTRNQPMAVVTNGSKSQLDKIEVLEASRYFKAVLISGEVGIAKPDPRIFQQALSRLNAAPGQSVFVGDSMEHDIAGARNAGMMTVYIRKGEAEDPDDALCDLVVSDLRELSDLVIGLDACK
ncbi:MAG: HAD family hydrolase [Gemmatimonadetes bacterium]|nr:HAD family hydrolase [Gemmatimonadota bacterium]